MECYKGSLTKINGNEFHWGGFTPRNGVMDSYLQLLVGAHSVGKYNQNEGKDGIDMDPLQ